MRLFGKSAIVLGMAGAMAFASMTASEARNHRGAFVAGAAGFAAGAAIGAAASNGYYNNGYYDNGYYDNGYNAYGYADGPAVAYTADPSYYGGSTYSYSPQYYGTQNGPLRERVLEGRDY